jgi:Major Facilitator Superfamily
VLPAVLKLPQFRLLFSGEAVSVIGDGLFPVALAFAVLDELGGSPGQLGLVLAAETLPLAILILAAGVWADRLNRRNVMVVSDLGRAAVQATLATLLLSDAAHLWHVVALAALYGVFDAFFQPAAGGLVPEIAGREHLQEANALLGLARHVGLVVGPALAGVLIAVSSPGTAIAVDAATFVISAAFLTQLRVTFVRRASEHHFWADLKGGIAEVARRLDVDVHAGLLRLPPARAPVRARARAGDRRPRAERRVELGDDHGVLRDRHDPRQRRGAAHPRAAPDVRRDARVHRRELPGADHRRRRQHGRDRGAPGRGGASPSPTGSRCGTPASAARSRRTRSRASPRWTGSPPRD